MNLFAIFYLRKAVSQALTENDQVTQRMNESQGREILKLPCMTIIVLSAPEERDTIQISRHPTGSWLSPPYVLHQTPGQGSANHSLPSVFVNKVLLEHSRTHSLTIVYGCFHSTTAIEQLQEQVIQPAV